MNTFKKDLRKVVDGGFCVGCGACAFATNTKMELNGFGEYTPSVDEIESLPLATYEAAETVCPSLNHSQNEDVLARRFVDSSGSQSDYIGFYESIYGGYVTEGNYRANGTSGGFGTWVGAALFRQGLIDGVIHVKEISRDSASAPFFKYGISTTLNEIEEGSRTKYHVVEMSEVLTLIKQTPGKYLFIGVPCMVKAVRRLQLRDESLRQSIKYTASLVCGHMKSMNWTLSLGWAKGIVPKDATGFRYRTKGDGIPARAYVFTAYSDARDVVENSANVIGGKFNQGALMLEACNFCDDVVGETADITIGDAWLPQFEVDSQGTNMLIVRNKEIDGLINAQSVAGNITITDLTEAEAKDAQSGGFRQRGEGLSYRLHQKDIADEWRPVKRVLPNSFTISPLRRLIYRLRHKVAVVSRAQFREALSSNDYGRYRSKMSTLLRTLRFLEIVSSAPRIVRKQIAYLRLRS